MTEKGGENTINASLPAIFVLSSYFSEMAFNYFPHLVFNSVVHSRGVTNVDYNSSTILLCCSKNLPQEKKTQTFKASKIKLKIKLSLDRGDQYLSSIHNLLILGLCYSGTWIKDGLIFS